MGDPRKLPLRLGQPSLGHEELGPDRERKAECRRTCGGTALWQWQQQAGPRKRSRLQTHRWPAVPRGPRRGRWQRVQRARHPLPPSALRVLPTSRAAEPGNQDFRPAGLRRPARSRRDPLLALLPFGPRYAASVPVRGSAAPGRACPCGSRVRMVGGA